MSSLGLALSIALGVLVTLKLVGIVTRSRLRGLVARIEPLLRERGPMTILELLKELGVGPYWAGLMSVEVVQRVRDGKLAEVPTEYSSEVPFRHAKFYVPE